MSSPLASAETRRAIERLYPRLGSGEAVADVLEIPRGAVYRHLKARDLTRRRDPAERVRIMNERRHERKVAKALRLFRAINPEESINETGRRLGLPKGAASKYLRFACEHLGVDYLAARQIPKYGNRP